MSGEASAQQASRLGTGERAVSPSAGSPGAHSVLLISQDAATLLAFRRDLSADDWHIEVASSAERAARLLASKEYELVAVDLSGSSPEAAEQLKLLATTHTDAGHLIIVDRQRGASGDLTGFAPTARVVHRPWAPGALDGELRAALIDCHASEPGSGPPSALGSVLLIEDNTADAELAEAYLKAAGSCSVTRAERLSDALAHLHERQFDFVLTGLSLPDVRGLEAISRVQEAARDSAVVVLSGMMDEHLSLEAVQRGAQDFILKDRVDPYRLGSCLRFARERKRTQLRLERLANEDPLTGLFNRRMFMERLEHLLARARRTGQRFAVMFVDLDRFKHINDRYGHDAGDTILRETARRIVGVLRDYDTVARLGGDEFAILVEDVQGLESTAEVARRLVASLARPHDIDSHQLITTPSVGVAMFPESGDTSAALLGGADKAMYEVKRGGRNAYRICAPVTSGSQRVSSYCRALVEKQYILHFQPQHDLATGEIVAFEALIRWQKEDKLVLPNQFISELEATGDIVLVGEWVLDAACKQVARWRKDHGSHLRMAVNVSARQFASECIVTAVTRALERHALPPQALELEITEGTLMRDTAETWSTLALLKRLGVRVAVDDFGTGYSSLAYLSRFPVDALKIDRSFISQALECSSNATITSAIVGLGHRLGLQVVAEGVEALGQLEFLREQGCDLVQGFLLGRPTAQWPSPSSSSGMGSSADRGALHAPLAAAHSS